MSANVRPAGEGRPALKGLQGDSHRPGSKIVNVRNLERFSLPLVWVLVIAVFSALRPETFFTWANMSTILGSQAVLVVLALALIIPLTSGDYDLSIAAVLTLTAMIIAQLNAVHQWPIVLAALVAVAVAALVGLMNGLIIVYFGIDSLIVTLGTSTLLQGVILWISDSNTVSGISQSLVDWVIMKRLLGVPMCFWYGLILCAIIWFFLESTPAGRRLLFAGRGRSVARLSGINVGRIRILAFVASACVAAFAGILYAGTTGAADPSSGLQFLLPAFAAAFLGATAINPGRFNAWGTLVAVYFLVTGITGLQLLGLQSYVQQLFYGGALIVAVVLSQLVRGRESRGDN